MKDLSLNDKTLAEVKQVKEELLMVRANMKHDGDLHNAVEHVLVYLNNHIMFLEWKETK